VTTMSDAQIESYQDRLARLESENRALRALVRSAAEAADRAALLERLEAENRHLRDRMARLQRLASLGTMSAMVAHEFNNILTPVISYAELAQKDPTMADKAIARAVECGQRATDICNAILGVAGGDSPEPVGLDLEKLVRETVRAIGRDPKRDGIDLAVEVPPGLAITTRKVEFQHVLLNLLLNARTAVLKKSGRRRIEVTAERGDGQVILRVADNGVGIPPEDLSRVFEAFYTTGDGGGDGGGHGLGLTVCREIVSSLGGRIAVESQPGQGATFTVSLAG